MSETQSIRQLDGTENSVVYMPGDRFTGVDLDWLIERLVLNPEYGRVHFSPYEKGPSLSCFLDGEEVDVLSETGEFPMRRDKDFYKHPIAQVGRDDPFSPDLVSATLYDASPWLVSVWLDVHEDYIPVPEGSTPQETQDRKTFEVWGWVVDMVTVWVQSAAEHDLPITSELLTAQSETTQEFISQVTEAAQGGRGTVTVNGTVVYEPGETQ
ncbi:MAG TPA: hypothetical protein VIG24_00060 [Acidimicrobiia bacterium]